MSSAAASMFHPVRDALRPRVNMALGRGAALAVLVHAGLLLALSGSLHWRTQQQTVFSAELWAAVPQLAAPRADVAPPPPPKVAPAPPPPPREAQIAVEKAKPAPTPPKPKPEPEPPKAITKPAAKPEPKPDPKVAREKEAVAERERQRMEDDRLARQREENLKRMLNQVGAGAAPQGQASQDAGPSASYAGRVKARIYPNILFTESVASNVVTEVEVQVAPDGTVVSRRVVKSSGNAAWDDAVLRAIDKTRVLPRDTDGRVQPSMTISFTPRPA